MATISSSTVIPREILFAQPEIVGVKISPNAQHLAFVKGQADGTMNIFVCPVSSCQDTNNLKQLTNFTAPEIYRFFWTDDSQHIVFLQDTNGAKGYQIYSVNINTGKLINHTGKFKDINGNIFKVSGTKVAVGINDRNPKFHDIYILDAKDGSLTKIFENDKFSRFTFDENLKIIFKEIVNADGSIDVYRGDTVYLSFSAEDAFHSRLLKVQGDTLYYVDSRNSDTTMLKSIDLKTNQETKIAHDSKSDIINVLFIDDKPSVYSTVWLKKQWHSLGKLDLKKITQQLGSSFDVTSQAKNIWVIRYVEPKRIGASFYLYDIDTGQITMLYEARTNKHLADMIPFEFTTRDGLLLTAYLTLPEKYASIESIKKPIPLIVHPHGGPFQARDNWEYDPFHQWLASRGYAVLSVNFRLSSGLGKKLVNAGNGEWGRKAQYDLIDGMQWCIEQGITTKDKVGIVGASYGGYATLAGLAFTPDEFAVGVDLVGPSNLITTMQKVPNYWDWPSYKLSDRELFFTKGAFIKSMGGNPDTQAGREFLASRSPLNYANQISKPLLIIQGDNDPIINKSESIQIYNELKRLGKKTCLLSFPDEGHRIQRYPNQETYLAYIEQWLHDILGGEVEPLNHKLRAESSVVIQE